MSAQTWEQLRAETRVLDDVRAERVRQDAKWGEQNHEDGTGSRAARAVADNQCAHNDAMLAAGGRITWRDILLEEVYEALGEDDPAELRCELVQVAAVAVQWVQAIDRRQERMQRAAVLVERDGLTAADALARVDADAAR